MKTLFSKLLFCVALSAISFIVGCGGGGFGASPIVTGRIVWLASGSGPTPAPAVQVGSRSVNASADGSFSITVPKNSSSFLVVYQPITGPAITFNFSTPPVVGNIDVGDWYIGPQKVAVTGRVLNASSNAPVPVAAVTLGGINGVTDSSGNFTLNNVAFDPSAIANFLSLEGRAAKAGFFPKIFSPAGVPTGGATNTDDILLTEDTGTVPPGTPFNVEGILSPAGDASGAIVELYSGLTLIRSFTVSADRKYGFWVLPGTYTLKARKPGSALIGADQSVVLSSQTQTVRKDVTLN